MSTPSRLRAVPDPQHRGRPSAVSLPILLLLAFSAIALTHWTLLRLPYFWDEGGYYVPAALDFYRTGTLIPVFTNAHPPLPNVVLGTLWHIFGLDILVTRLTACAFAAGGLLAVFVLGNRLLGRAPAVAITLLTAIYPVWFAQSSLAHADIFAAAFTLAGFALFLSSPDLIGNSGKNFSGPNRLAWASAMFCLSVLAKETAVVQPVALAATQLLAAFMHRTDPARRRAHLRWSLALGFPVLVLACWYTFHYSRTGFVFGNPEFLRYNATGNLTLQHVLYAFRIRCVHLFWQRNIWLPLALAAACLLLPSLAVPQRAGSTLGLPQPVFSAILVLVVANLLAFSVLGGALLTRYLLPVYPLLLLLCVAAWTDRTTLWPWLAALTGIAFLSALWLNPFAFFAPEDNLTYRDMIVAQAQAVDFLNTHYPDATVLTAWPVSADLTRPELGYTSHRFKVSQIDNFTTGELAKAAAQPGKYDTALVFTTHYTSPAFRSFLLTHPKSWRGRRYAADLDLSPAQIAQNLGGEVVWQTNHYGEWAAVLRFRRSYSAQAGRAPSGPRDGSLPR